MKYFTHLITRPVVLILLFLIFPQKVYAYVDPGTGSYIFQLIIAALVGGLFVVKLFWNKIKIFFRNLFSREKNMKR